MRVKPPTVAMSKSAGGIRDRRFGRVIAEAQQKLDVVSLDLKENRYPSRFCQALSGKSEP